MLDTEPITTAQLRALLAVEYLVRAEDAPTVTRVAELLGCSRSTAHTHLQTLRRKGWVTWAEGTAGSIRPTVRAVAQDVAR